MLINLENTVVELKGRMLTVRRGSKLAIIQLPSTNIEVRVSREKQVIDLRMFDSIINYPPIEGSIIEIIEQNGYVVVIIDANDRTVIVHGWYYFDGDKLGFYITTIT